MNIKEYYSVMRKVYVNQLAIIAIFVTACTIFLFNYGKTLILIITICVAVLFLLYMFARYLYYIHQETKSSSNSLSHEITRQSDRFLLMFLPAPSLNVKFFKSDGVCEWELTDENIKKRKWFLPLLLNEWKNQTYLLKKRSGDKVASFKIGKGSAVISLNDEKISLLKIEKERNKMVFSVEGNKYVICKNSSAYEIYKDDNRLSTIGKGWMPIKWQKHFSPNTPIMEINRNINDREFYIILFFIIYLFANQKN